MNDVVRNRLREICPDDELEGMDFNELVFCCKVAFKIIGYEYKDLPKSIESAKESSKATDLSDFIYDVWRLDG